MARRGAANRFQPLQNQMPNENQIPNQHQNPNQSYSQVDNPGIILVPTLFNGENFFPWRRAIKRSLVAKEKIEYIKDSAIIPATNSPIYSQWYRNDCLVTFWILNSMTKEFAEAFLYATSSKNLWKELEDRFRGSNGPRIFQIKREISLLSQGNNSVMYIFTQLKKLWDELELLRKLPTCVCGAAEACICNVDTVTREIIRDDKLMQFLMGLNEGYESIIS